MRGKGSPEDVSSLLRFTALVWLTQRGIPWPMPSQACRQANGGKYRVFATAFANASSFRNTYWGKIGGVRLHGLNAWVVAGMVLVAGWSQAGRDEIRFRPSQMKQTNTTSPDSPAILVRIQAGRVFTSAFCLSSLDEGDRGLRPCARSAAISRL